MVSGRKKWVRFSALLLMSVALPSLVHAQVNSWANPASGTWNWGTAANWSLGQTPSITQSAIFITNSAADPNFPPSRFRTVIVGPFEAGNPGMMTVSNLTTSGTPGTILTRSFNTLYLSNAGTATPLHILNSFTISANSAVNITNSVLRLDGSTTNDFGGGELGIDGTLNLYDGGMLLPGRVTNRHQFAVAVGVTGSGALNINGGTASLGIDGMDIGYGAGSFGSVSISGGQLLATTVVGNVYDGIGIGSSSSAGILFQSGGYLESEALIIDNGTLSVSGGTQLPGALWIGTGYGTGNVWVTGGQLLATNGGFGPQTYIGLDTTGFMTISNGTFMTTEIVMGYNPGGFGTLTVAGGSCIIAPYTLFVDNFYNTTCMVWVTGGQLISTNIVLSTGLFGPGPGSLTQSNGLVQTRNEYVGGYSNAVGTLTVAGGTHMVGDGTFSIASDVPATGVVWMTGGQLLASGQTEVGHYGVGDLIVSNGTVLASQMNVGLISGSKGMLLTAGGTTTASGMVIGDCVSNAVGTVFVRGGSVFVTNAAHNAVLDVRNGWVVLTAGQLVVDKLVMTNSCGFFFHGGGVLNVGSLLLDPSLDADGDGLPNGWEQAYGLDPLSSTGNNGGDGDPDGDGFTNWEEYQGGSDPTNPNSIPLHITSIMTQGSDVLLTWLTKGGKTNVVQATNGGINGNYATNGFSNISPTIFVTGSGLTTTNYLDHGGATNAPARFYRVRQLP